MIIIIIINFFLFVTIVLSYIAYRLQLAAWLNCNWGGGVDCFLCISNTFIWKGIVKLSWVLEGGSKMSVIPFCIDFCAFWTLLCENPPKEHFVSELTGALSLGGGVKIVNFSILYWFLCILIKISTLSRETPPKVHFVSKLTGMSNFERNPFPQIRHQRTQEASWNKNSCRSTDPRETWMSLNQK